MGGPGLGAQIHVSTAVMKVYLIDNSLNTNLDKLADVWIRSPTFFSASVNCIIFVIFLKLSLIYFSIITLCEFQIDNVDRPSWQAQLSGSKVWTLIPPPECENVCKTLKAPIHKGEVSKQLLSWATCEEDNFKEELN